MGLERTVAEGHVSRDNGQVENQVGTLRDQFFRPKPRVSSLVELNAWLEDQRIAYAKRHPHPEFKDRTIWEVFQEEQPSLIALRGPFDCFVEKAVRATTCLIMADHNRHSVDARAAGRMVLVRSHAERIVVLLDDVVVADHSRQFRRNQIVYDPWHYLPVLMRKQGALRNGAPFKDWDLPPALAKVRAKLKQRIWRQRPTCSAAQHRVMMMPSSDGTGMEWAIVSSLSTVRMRFRTVLSTVISTMRNAGKWRLTDGAALR